MIYGAPERVARRSLELIYEFELRQDLSYLNRLRLNSVIIKLNG